MTPQEDLGEIKINNEVVGTIAALAAVEVDGIVSLAGKFSLAEMWGRKDMEKGFSVEIDAEAPKVKIRAEINVEYGVDIYKAAHQLQQAVKNAVEGMTGLKVEKVDVTVRGIVMGEHPRRAAGPTKVKSIGEAE
jgi:uncharacterized alkaline shock family protein YloU